jgi:hypothetical protein
MILCFKPTVIGILTDVKKNRNVFNIPGQTKDTNSVETPGSCAGLPLVKRM